MGFLQKIGSPKGKKKVFFQIFSGILILFFLPIGCRSTEDRSSVKKEISSSPPASSASSNRETEKKGKTQEKKKDFQEILRRYVKDRDPEKALASLEEYRRSSPLVPREEFIYASLLIKAGKNKQAGTVLDSLLEKEPEQIKALYLKAFLLSDEGRTEEALQVLNTFLSKEPGSPEARLLQGRLLFKKENYGGAVQSFAAVLKASMPGSSDFREGLIGRGKALLWNGQVSEAFRDFDKALQEGPDPRIYRNRAVAYGERGRYGPAEKDMSEAIRLDPENPWNYLDRGRIRLKLNKDGEALSDFREASRRAPELYLPYVYIGGIYRKKLKFDRAVLNYEKVLRIKPEYYFPYLSLGEIYYTKGEWEKSYRNFLNMYRFDPRTNYLLLAAVGMIRAGDRKKARSLLDRTMRLMSPSDPFRDMVRFYAEDFADRSILRRISELKNKGLRAQMFFYWGASLGIRGSGEKEMEYYRKIAYKFAGTPEAEIAMLMMQQKKMDYRVRLN